MRRWVERVAEVEPKGDEISDSFARLLAIAIVVTTLFAAGVEWLRSWDENQAAHLAVKAQMWEVDANSLRSQAQQETDLNFEAFNLSQEQRAEQASALQNLLASSLEGPIAGRPQSLLQAEEKRWTKLALLNDALTEIKPNGATSREQDINFPQRFLSERLTPATRLSALQDAANSQRDALADTATRCAVILTMLAVGLYLFGLALSLRLPIRLGVAVLAGMLVLVSIPLTVVVSARSPEGDTERAAAEFALGRQQSLIGYADFSAYQRAIDHYTRAINLRKEFGLAYQERADAEFYLGAPYQAAVDISSASALRKAVDDDRTALRYQQKTAAVLGSLGFYEFLLGLSTNDARLINESISDTRQALKISGDYPELAFNLGLSLLGAGQDAQARSAYQDAVKQVVWLPNGSVKKLRDDRWLENYWATSAVTDLEILLQARPQLASTIRETERDVVTSIAARDLSPKGPSRTATDINLDIYSSALQWRAKISGYDPKADVASVNWLYRDPDKHYPWVVLSSASGWLSSLTPNSQAGTDAYYVNQKWLPSTGSCLRSGYYRADIYINGTLAGSQETDNVRHLDQFDGRRFLDLGVATCRPSDWQAVANAELGYRNGFSSADKSRGVFFVRFQNPPTNGADKAAITRRYLTLGIQEFSRQFGIAASYVEPYKDQYFVGLTAPRVEWHQIQGGWILAGAGLTTDNTVLVGLVFGPTAWYDSNQPIDIMQSFELAR